MNTLPSVEWRKVNSCPSCGSPAQAHDASKLPSSAYLIGNERISLPDEGILLQHCDHCQLRYKDTLPTPEALTRVFSRNAGNIWTEDYDYLAELQLTNALFEGKRFDALDIGPSTGRLLERLQDKAQRRSGLDVIAHPGLLETLSGEFIQGYLEDTELQWSGEPYDVITAFDVMEHLYDPHQAFRNLHSLLKEGGYLIVETGNIASLLPRFYGVGNWWYVNLIEHHIFWTPAALSHFAKQYGFQVVQSRQKRHKRAHLQPWAGRIETAMRMLWYTGLQMTQAKNRPQPWCALNADHFLLVLRKQDSPKVAQAA